MAFYYKLMNLKKLKKNVADTNKNKMQVVKKS